MIPQSRPHTAFDELVALAMAETEQPTERLPIVRLASPRKPVSGNTEPLLLPPDSIDTQKRFYLFYNGPSEYLRDSQSLDEISSLWDDTLHHVERLTEQYRKQLDRYPDEICLSAQRYFARPWKKGMKKGMPERVENFYPREYRIKMLIPLTWEWQNVGQYEVLVRGRAK